MPLVDYGHQYRRQGVVLDVSRPGHIHLRKYNPHPYLLIYIQGLDSSNIITIQSPKQPKILRFVKKYIFRYPP